jgi:2-desacetyl-2-hydroxyethyl bacteriochlorophyllide A dehydrogenase
MNRKVVTFTAREKVELLEEPLPEPGPGDVMLEATRSLISTGTEMIVLQQNFDPGTHWARWGVLPFRAGYSLVGRITQTSGDCGGLKVGDRVAARWHHCSRAVLSHTECVRIPEGVSDDEATWFGIGKIVQIGVRTAEHVMGDVVCVVGLGPLGQLVTQYARLMGASEVIAIDIAERRLALAAAHGATATLKMTAAEALDLRHRLGGRGADVVYDVTGASRVFATVLPLARQFGKVILLGDAPNPSQQTLTTDVINRGLKILGAHDSHSPLAASEHIRWTGDRMYELFFTYLQRKQIRTADLITHRFKPDDAPAAYRMLKTEREAAMGVMFDWQ